MYYNQKVDFHSHYLPPTYYRFLEEYEGDPYGFPTKWTEQGHLALMDKLGIAFSFISVSTPNLSSADKETEIKLAHQINIEGAQLVNKHPDKLGLMAALPLPHTKEAVDEARFAIEELKADGFALSTNYAGIYLGNEKYDKLMDYLDSIAAVVAVHPAKPSAVPQDVNEYLPIPAFEFLVDTTRTFSNMVMHNIFEKYPNIKWIFPHGGAFISTLSDRINGFATMFREWMDKPVPIDFKADMKHVYFDLAGFPVSKQIHDLLIDVSVDNLLYGSDAPYTPNIACVSQTGALEKYADLSEDQKNVIFTANAVKLFPRLADILNVGIKGHTVCYTDKPLSVEERANRNIRCFISKVYSKIFK